MSDTIQDRYLSNGAQSCPFCESDQIEGSSIEIEGTEVYSQILCLGCKGEWHDIYKLTEIELTVFPNKKEASDAPGR